MDDSSDQTPTTQDSNQQPVVPTDQPPVEAPPAQEPTTETQTNPVPSETPATPTPPNPPSFESQSTEPQTSETPQPIQPETQVSAETPPQPEQPKPVVPPPETQPPISPPVINIPALHFPFSGNIPITFAFGAQSDNEDIKKKFSEWGIVGHNGLDFGMGSGMEVFPCDSGKVIQSGDNGDFGTSITIQHSWGQSLYAHLSETKVKVDDEIQPNKVIGLSGASGAAFGEHLHFAIRPNNPDSNNGYLGFIDPAPCLSQPSQKEEQKPPETPQQPVQEQPKPEETKPQPSEVPPPINYEPEKPTEPTQEPNEQPQQSETPETPQLSPEEIQKQVDEKLKTDLDLRRQKANQARQTKREEHLMQIEKLIEEKKQVNNQDVCDLLHVSQSTATNYLTDLVKRGTIKLNGKGKATTYSY